MHIKLESRKTIWKIQVERMNYKYPLDLLFFDVQFIGTETGVLPNLNFVGDVAFE